MSKQLDSDFFARNSVSVARELIGKYLLTPNGGGMILETEAYRQDDPACHAYLGRRSKRNASMFLAPGSLYVYRIHQVFCLNLSSESEENGAAVLIRAIEPSLELESMLKRRPVKAFRDLCNGPGKLCQALGIDLSWDGLNYGKTHSDKALWIEDQGLRLPDQSITSTPRIGISQGRELPWRFVLKKPAESGL
jgi:DNA-3-methyladenine glycosylase